tara:strand:+ start:1111 stop:1422 length:312 start_codon:yes stop_codon:yes gene_type:complete
MMAVIYQNKTAVFTDGKRERKMSYNEFLKVMLDQITAYSSIGNQLGDVLEFLGKIVEIDEKIWKDSSNDKFVVDVSNAFLKTNNAEMIGEVNWEKLYSHMAQS